MVGDAGDVNEERAAARHRYRICEVLDNAGKSGRPKRVELMSWDDLSDEDVERLRRLNEGRLKPRQVAELDGRTVARGAAVQGNEVEESEPSPAAANIRYDNPLEILEFGRRMSWDIYERDAQASERLRNEVHELNQRAIDQGKQLLEILELAKTTAQRPPPEPPGRPLSMDDVSQLIKLGAEAVREILKTKQ